MGITEEEEKLSKKYQIFVGREINKSIHRVKGKSLVEYAEALGDINLKYVGVGTTPDGKPDYSTIIAHPSYPNCFTVDAAFDLTGWKYPPEAGDDAGKNLIINYGKVLHTSQAYDYSKAECSIKHGQKLYTTGYLEKAYIRNKGLWLIMHLDTHTEEGELVVQSEVMTVFREGGYY